MKLHLLKRWEENVCLWRVTYKCHGLWRATFCTSVLFSSNFTSCTLFHSCLCNDDRSLLCHGESESDSIIWYANSLLKWTEPLRGNAALVIMLIQTELSWRQGVVAILSSRFHFQTTFLEMEPSQRSSETVITYEALWLRPARPGTPIQQMLLFFLPSCLCHY